MKAASASLRIYLLGEMRLEYETQRITLPRRERLQRLFVRLVLLSGQPQSRKGLAFSLWPDESESEALANLRRHLYLLRNFLPTAAQGFLVIAPQTVTWQPSPACWVDVFAFEGAAQHPETLERAVDLYHGDLAAGVDEDEYILARREELRRIYLNLLKRLAQECLERREHEHALKWARKLTACDPWDEEAARLKMTIEALAGNRASALATYQALATKLQRELATQPMPETMALYSDILHNHLPRKKTLPEQVFISRERELAQLAALFQPLSRKHGAMAFISGEAGVGKTSLLQEALRRFVENDGEKAPLLFWGHCQPSAGRAPLRPYAPWKQIFTAVSPLLARNPDIPPEWLNHLLPLLPEFSLLRPGLLAPSQPDAAQLRAALRQTITFLAAERPLALVIEDAHWADPASLELLTDLADACQSLPLLVLITHRPGDAPLALLETRRTLRRQRCAHEILLQPFTAEESRLLLENLLGREAITPALQNEIAQYTQGLPLLLCEAAESLQKAKETSQRSLPTLREAIRMRMEQLPHEALQMLEAAAVLGFSFSNRELESLLAWQDAAYAATLDTLQTHRFLLDSRSSEQDDYTFSHKLIHQIILESIPAARALTLHQQAARALEQVHAGQAGFAAEIAAHYQAAQQAIPAARYWLVHAQELGDLAAFDQAEEAIQRALDLIKQFSSREARELTAQAALLRGVLAHYRGQAAQALPRLENALAACREFPALYANALARQAHALYTCDRYLEAAQAAAQSLEIARALQEPSALVRALNIRGIAALMLGQNRQASQDLQEALSLEQALAQPSVQTVQSLNHLGTALVFVQEYAQAIETLHQTIELAHQGGLKRLESAALTMLGQIALNQGRYDEAIRLYSHAIEVAGASYLPGMWGKFAGRGAAFLRMGSLREARSDFEQGLQIARQVESSYGQILMRSYLAFTALAAGEDPPASLADLEAEAAALNLHAVVLFTATLQAQIWRLACESEKARSAHARSLSAASASNVPSFVQTARLQEMLTLAAHSTPIDLPALKDLRLAVTNSGETPLQSLSYLAEAHHLRNTGCPAPALQAAQTALTLARSCPDQPLIGESLLLLARLYEEMNQPAQAQRCYAEARALADSCFAPLRLGLPGG